MPSMSTRHFVVMLTLGIVGSTGCGSDTTGSESGLGGSAMTSGGSTANTGGFAASSAVVLGQGGAITDRGGQPAQGGNSTTSNSASGIGVGGVASGGVASGGVASGGNPAGGNTMGSNATGGIGTGGRSSGGASFQASGGKAAGGNGTAGAAKGGATNGGSANGGTTNGGTTNGGATNGGRSVGGASVGGASVATSGGAAGSGTSAIKVWIAGDSTVQNCSSACPCGWGSQFDALFNSNVTVVNSAVGGRSIQTWLYDANVSDTLGTNGECTLTSTAYNTRWTNMTNATSGMKPGDYLFIQFGINDGDTKCPRHVGTALYKTYLAMMAKAAKAAGAQPIFLTATSAISCSGSNAVATRGFLTETKAAGSENDVPVIDLHQLSIGLYNKLALCPNSADYTSTTSKVGLFFCEDHTHFEAAGAKQIAQVVAQALTDQGIGLAAYLL